MRRHIHVLVDQLISILSINPAIYAEYLSVGPPALRWIIKFGLPVFQASVHLLIPDLPPDRLYSRHDSDIAFVFWPP